MSDAAAEIVVTGLGAVSPFGYGVDALWNGLCAGETAIGPFDLFDTAAHRTRVAGAVPGASAPAGPRRMTRAERFALHAADEALRTAGLRPGEDALAWAGVFLGSSTAGMYESERVVLRREGERGAHAYGQFAGQPLGTPAATVARHCGTGGAVETISTACCASTMAVEAALASLRAGEHEVALACGVDGLCEVTYAGFNSLRAVSGRSALPFRGERDGLSLGEGAGVLVLETREHAGARGAEVLAVLAGAASSCDAHHMTAPRPDGAQARAAIEAALRDAGVPAGELAAVVAHGTGTPHNDLAEAAALQAALDGRHAAVTAPKGAVGHLLGGCGALEAVVAVQCLRERLLPPTPGGGAVDDDARLDLVLDGIRPLADSAPVVLSLNLAFGGANAALVFR